MDSHPSLQSGIVSIAEGRKGWGGKYVGSGIAWMGRERRTHRKGHDIIPTMLHAGRVDR